MLKITLGLGALYAIAYVCSLAQSPEERAATDRAVNAFGWKLFQIVYGTIAAVVLLSLAATSARNDRGPAPWHTNRH